MKRTLHNDIEQFNEAWKEFCNTVIDLLRALIVKYGGLLKRCIKQMPSTDYLNRIMKCKIIKFDGSTIEVEPLNGKNFKLNEMQEIVSGDIEALYLSDTSILIVNEEAKLLGLPFNESATEKLEGSKYAGDFLCGNVLHISFDKIN